MHEMSLALHIVDLAMAAAEGQGGGRISRVELEVGELAGVLVEALRFGFEAASRATPVEGAELWISPSPGRGYCVSCGAACQPASLIDPCPACRGFVRITGGQELRLVAVTVEEEEGDV